MQDLYLDSDFQVIDNDFIFKATNDHNTAYNVLISFDDVAAFTGCPVDIVQLYAQVESEKQNIIDSCQQIVDAFQAGRTSYDVEAKRAKVECYEFTKQTRGTQENAIYPTNQFFGEKDIKNFMLQNNFKSYKTVMA
ncbi:hypothetical protein AB832_07745 [Flavobacteriaceae bacterium (ex Bugula neritina AB1)]|nr:hypothetical protein AB832_07745 [Flavobacteriaceae bacterium (ex Bugula neritina AB1)]